MTKYTAEDQENSRLGTLALAGTDLEIIIYRINETDVCLLVNKGGICAYRCSLRNALTDILPFTDPHPLIDDTFIIRDVAQAREFLATMSDDEAQQRLRDRLRD